MVLFSHSSYEVGAEQTKKRKTMKLKKDLWINEEGKIAEGTDGLPKGWAKGKLLGKKGDEVSDLQAKEWGIDNPKTKAKAPAENKAK